MANNNLINKRPDTNRTQHSVGYFGSSGALSGIGPLTNGQLAIGSNGTNAQAATLSSSSGSITYTTGAGTLDLSATITPIIVQMVTSSTAALVHCTTAIPPDDTIPQNTEGDEVLTCAITPTNSNNLLVIEFEAPVGTYLNNANYFLSCCALFQDTTANALSASWGSTARVASSGGLDNHYINYSMTAGTTSSTTFKIRVGPTANGYYADVNGFNNGRWYGGVSSTRLTITEIKV